MRRAAFALGILVAGLAPALAAPPAVLIAGTMQAAATRAGTTAWCTLALGPSSFLRNPTPATAPAHVSFPDVVYTVATSSGSTYYAMSGQAELTFTSATAGKVSFPYVSTYPLNVRSPTFSGYSQVYTAAHVLLVKLVIQFPQGCALTVNAIYRN